MKRKNIKFTDKNQSRRGMISSACGACALLLLAGVTASAYVYSGQAGRYVAVLALLALFLSAAGLYYGLLGNREEDTWKLFPRLGCVLNGCVLAACMLLYIQGW